MDKASKQMQIEGLGATAIDRHQTTVEEYVKDHTGGRGFDVVYDTVGGAGIDAAFNAVGGSATSSVASDGAPTRSVRSRSELQATRACSRSCRS